MRIVITGSNGYIGNFLAEHFCKKGHKVLGLDTSSMPRQKRYKNFNFKKCDVRDRDCIIKLILDFKPTHVFHLAYLMNPQHDRKFEYDVDVIGSLNVYEAAKATKAKQFIHFSSASIYGGFPNNKPWIKETQKPRPRDWVYAQNKKIIERYMFKNKKKSMKLVNLRLCTAVGPSYYKPGGVVKTLAKSPIGININNKPTDLQFVHEDDVKAVVENITKNKSMEGLYNLAPDSYATTKELTIGKKLFIPIPKFLFKIIISLLWNLRISPISPTSVNLVAHGIVVSPRKLMKKLRYKFEYTTKQAFFDAAKKRGYA